MAKFSKINPTKLEELYQFDIENGDNLLPELFTVFQKSAALRMSELIRSFETQEWRSLVVQAHTLKASAGNLGAYRVEALCRKIEDSYSVLESSELRRLIDEIQKELDHAVQELSGIITEKYNSAA
jgi:HPt (histidine-containing phosphotransfer) domain-containing protein